MERRSIWMAAFLLFLMALLSPVNNLFQSQEKTNPYTDTEYQVVGIAVIAGIIVIVALAQKCGLGLNAIPFDVPRALRALCRKFIVALITVHVDTSPPQLAPLRI